jgi:hypothetical protein
MQLAHTVSESKASWNVKIKKLYHDSSFLHWQICTTKSANEPRILCLGFTGLQKVSDKELDL